MAKMRPATTESGKYQRRRAFKLEEFSHKTFGGGTPSGIDIMSTRSTGQHLEQVLPRLTLVDESEEME